MSAQFKDLLNYTASPFSIEGIEMKIRTIKEGEQEMIDHKTGELYIMKKIPSNKEILHDTYTYTKLFKESPIKIKSFSVPAFNLFYYIAMQLKIKQTEICINEDIFLEEFGYSKTSRRIFYQAVIELIEKGILAKKANASRCFFINPNVMFNGDRTK